MPEVSVNSSANLSIPSNAGHAYSLEGSSVGCMCRENSVLDSRLSIRSATIAGAGEASIRITNPLSRCRSLI